MRVGIDMDGVLADFNTTFIDLIVQTTGKNLFPPGPFDIPTWHYPEHYGYSRDEVKEVWEVVKNSERFWFMLQPYDDAVDFIKQLDPEKHDIYFITNRVGLNVKYQTESWLEFFQFAMESNRIAMPTVLISEHKGYAAAALNLDVYIDDKVENCEDVKTWTKDCKVFMRARPWNHEIIGVARIGSLKEFQSYIDGQ